ncbi:MAG: hypothetical protein U1E65_25505 [Myxococcota bacterium]
MLAAVLALTPLVLGAPVEGVDTAIAIGSPAVEIRSTWVFEQMFDHPIQVPLERPFAGSLEESPGLRALRDPQGQIRAVEVEPRAIIWSNARPSAQLRFQAARAPEILELPSPPTTRGHRAHLSAPWRLRPAEASALKLDLTALAPAGFPKQALDEVLSAAGLPRPEAPIYLQPGAPTLAGRLETPADLGPIVAGGFALTLIAALGLARRLARVSRSEAATLALEREIQSIDGPTDGRIGSRD